MSMKQLTVVVLGEITGVKIISDIDYNDYKTHRKVISDFSRDYELLRLVVAEHRGFEQGIAAVGAAILKEENIVNQNNLRYLIFDANKLMLRFLGGVRTFLDHTQTTISRRYGASSDELKYWKRLTAEQFDNFFSYRFLYKLRNYTQHCGMPPIGYSVTHVLNGIEIALNFDRKILLEEYNEWGALLKKELSLTDEPMAALTLLSEHVNSVVAIYLGFYGKYLDDSVGASKDWICSLLSDPAPDDKYCFMEVDRAHPDDASKIAMRIEWIPTSMVREVLEIEKNLPAILWD